MGLFDEIWICAVEYNEDETSHLICLMGVQNSAQQAIVKSIKEVLSFTDIDLGNIDVAHFSYDDEVCTKIREIGIKLEFPEVSEVKNATRDVKNKAALAAAKTKIEFLGFRSRARRIIQRFEGNFGFDATSSYVYLIR